MTRVKRGVRLDPGLEILSERLSKVEVPCVLATVISATGSTYRKPGARMLIEGDGSITGLLSGGCLEQDLREHASGILSSGNARTVAYDMRVDNDLIFGTGAGCEGKMEILLEPVLSGKRTARAIRNAADFSRRCESSALVMIHDGLAEERGTYLWCAQARASLGEPLAEACAHAAESGRSQAFRWQGSSGACAAWIQPVLPLPAILICGAGPDAQPLSAAFRALHFPVTVADHRPMYASTANFPGATVLLGTAATLLSRVDLTHFFAAVVMSHHFASDTEYLRVLGPSDVEYLGLLGPRTRRARLLADLGDAAAAMDGRLRGPIGLDIGAVTPESIALAIAAEIHAAAARHEEPLPVSRLHDRRGVQ